MNHLIKILLLLLLPIFGLAQDSVTLISPSDFDKTSPQVYIAAMQGWIFRQGNDTAWAERDIDTKEWQKLNPSEFSVKFADASGKAEGWFRMKIKLSSDLGNQPMGIKLSTWAAADLYVNGNFMASFGSTGMDGQPYHELSPSGNLPVAANLKGGNEYILALHIVDWISPWPPRRLKSEDVGLNSLIRITSPEYGLLFFAERNKGSDCIQYDLDCGQYDFMPAVLALILSEPIGKKPSPDCDIHHVYCNWFLFSECRSVQYRHVVY